MLMGLDISLGNIQSYGIIWSSIQGKFNIPRCYPISSLLTLERAWGFLGTRWCHRVPLGVPGRSGCPWVSLGVPGLVLGVPKGFKFVMG